MKTLRRVFGLRPPRQGNREFRIAPRRMKGLNILGISRDSNGVPCVWPRRATGYKYSTIVKPANSPTAR